uniref:Phosphate-binding protein n=1 Tax=Anaerolinea thermolimosa TaxID=229919 RepID=A0A7C4KJS7_9CHLR
MKPFLSFVFAIILVLLGGCAPRSGAPSAPDAQPTRASAYIQNKGSDTIVNLALAWAERYQELHPDVRISVTGGGSGTGIAAMIDGTVDIANASRAMKAEEISAARAKGIEPVEHVVARDAIAVIVNPANPVDQLTLEQISLIYQGAINNWKEVGGEDRPIVRLSRETNSGTHVYFLEEVLRLGQKENKALFSMDTLLLPSSEGIIAEVMDNPNAIGYDGLGYVIPEVKVLGVAKHAGEPYVKPSVETVNSGEYPISRDLYMYTRKDAGQAVLDYLAWIKSSEAQKIVLKLGFVPIVGQSITRK